MSLQALRLSTWHLVNSPKTSICCKNVNINFLRRIITTDQSGNELGSLKQYYSTFEDESGNPLEPSGSLTYSRPIKNIKSRALLAQGGDGEISFLRLWCNDKAGPDGGDGGNGGHIILRVNPQVKSLSNVQPFYNGNPGENGKNKDMFGKDGEHLIIDVPKGTLIKKMHGEVIADLERDGSLYVVARGGAGGKGNHFYLSDQNRHPAVAEAGAKGEFVQLMLEMRCMAHAGLIGFPNAGKSTLLKAISRAQPKVASYAFTTRNPYVGIVHYDDYEQVAVADLPGLIEGAHKNVGMGLQFLKHVEKCVCLFFVIDISQKNPSNQLKALKFELDQYKSGLSKKPHAVLASKYDSDGLDENLNELKEYIKSTTPEGVEPLEVIPISGKYGYNLTKFLRHLRNLYDLYNKPDPDEEGFVW
ncbi:mitochondrial ribosome-associated GTPase 2 isoform X2 [Brevipalpus obovatus]|uniref:mitochondrial ribosome-associated GTPase 2 isoform X2 n=1 Tax=Brevipalpus obovatus TaxID=246614 RepID=UPI003D9E1F65